MSNINCITKSALSLIGVLQPAKKIRRKIEKLRYQRYYSQRDEYEVKIHGRKITFSTKDLYSGRWFYPRYATEIHEPKATALFARLSQRSEDIIDVGANLGWYTCIAARISTGTVHAFELDKDNARLLNNNIKINSYQNVEVKSMAVSNTESTIRYWKKRKSASVDYSFAGETEEYEEYVETEATTLDRYSKSACSSVDLLKIDVEGEEQKVLKGAQKMIQKFFPHILLEVHPSQLKSMGSSASNTLNMLPDNYEIYNVYDYCEKDEGSLFGGSIDPESFDPGGVTMLYAEPQEKPLHTFPIPSGPLYTIA